MKAFEKQTLRDGARQRRKGWIVWYMAESDISHAQKPASCFYFRFPLLLPLLLCRLSLRQPPSGRVQKEARDGSLPLGGFCSLVFKDPRK